MAGEKVISGNLRLVLDSKTIYHATESSLSLSREVRERSTKDTDGIQRAKGIKSFEASASALGVYGSDGADTSDFEALFDIYDDDITESVDIQFIPDESDATVAYEGKAIITALEGNFANEEDATVSITLSGSETLKKVTLPL